MILMRYCLAPIYMTRWRRFQFKLGMTTGFYVGELCNILPGGQRIKKRLKRFCGV